jgi:hypothetical protein
VATIAEALARAPDGKAAGWARQRKGTKTNKVRTPTLHPDMVAMLNARRPDGAKPDDWSTGCMNLSAAVDISQKTTPAPNDAGVVLLFVLYAFPSQAFGIRLDLAGNAAGHPDLS